MAFRRLLYVPSVYRSSLIDNDGYLEFCDLVNQLHDCNEVYHWYVIIPKWVKDGLKPLPGVDYIYYDSVRDLRVNQTVGFPALELAKDFARRGGRYVIDGVLTNCIGFAGYLRYILSDPGSNSRIPVFVRDCGDWNGVFRDVFEDWFVLASNLVSTHVAVRSETERNVFTGFLTKYANPSARNVFIKSSLIWTPGYSVTRTSNIDSKDRKPVMFCGGSFNSLFRRKIELEVASYLYAKNIASIVLVTQSPRHEIINIIRGGDVSFFDHFSAGAKRKECEIAEVKGDFFVSSVSEYFPLNVELEVRRLMLGQVGIFPYHGLAVERLGEKYPFFYNSENLDEAIVMAEWVAKNILEAKEAISSFVEDLFKLYDPRKTSMVLWKGMGKIIDENYRVHKFKVSKETNRKPVILVIKDIAEKLGERFSFNVIIDILEEHVPWLKPWNRKGTLKTYGEVPINLPTVFDLREMLDNLGWTDMCDGKDIFFERTKDINKEIKDDLTETS